MAEYEVFSSQTVSDSLQPCSNCGRTFMPESLVKHSRICAKSSKTVRKVFQSGKQRATGSDVPISKVLKSGVEVKPEKDAPKSNWKQQHEAFVNNLRAARGVQKALATGGPLPPPPPPVIDPSYVQCPTCSRRFNQKAAERHVPFCAEKNRRLPDKKLVSVDIQRRMQARVNYKTAKPKINHRQDDMYNNGDNYSRMGSNRTGGYSAGSLGSTQSRMPIVPHQSLQTSKLEGNFNTDRHRGHMSDHKVKSNMSRVASHESISRLQNGRISPSLGDRNGFAPSPPIGRPPSGNYQHRAREITAADARNNRIKAVSKFCHDCGYKFCRPDAKFCCDCGSCRMHI